MVPWPDISGFIFAQKMCTPKAKIPANTVAVPPSFQPFSVKLHFSTYGICAKKIRWL